MIADVHKKSPTVFVRFSVLSVFSCSNSRVRSLVHDDFEGIGGGVGGEFYRFSGLFQGQFVRYKAAHIQLAGEYQTGDFVLQKEVRRVASNQILFINTNSGQIEGSGLAPTGMREEQHLTTAA